MSGLSLLTLNIVTAGRLADHNVRPARPRGTETAIMLHPVAVTGSIRVAVPGSRPMVILQG